MSKLNTIIERYVRRVLKEYSWKDIKFTDCIVVEDSTGGFKVSCGGDNIGIFTTYKEAITAINKWKSKNSFRPDTWFEMANGKVYLIGSDGKQITKGR